MATHRREEEEEEREEDIVARHYELVEWLELWANELDGYIKTLESKPRLNRMAVDAFAHELALANEVLAFLKGTRDDDTRGFTARGDVSAHSGDQEDTSR